MDGNCSALLQLCLSAVIIISAVRAIHPLPKNSSDWCATDNATGYVAPPPDPVASQLEPFPSFNCAPMTKEECDTMGRLMIPECTGKSVIDLNLKHPKREDTYRMYRNISLGIPTIRADRAVSFGISDDMLLTSSVAIGVDYNILPEDKFIKQALEPIQKNIIELTLYKCSRRCPSKLRALQLTSLLSFTILECQYSVQKSVVFRKSDFIHNIRLRLITVNQCSSLEIESFTFTNLPDLRLLALEKNFFKDFSDYRDDRDSRLVPQLKKLHCECDYAWLRDLYRVNPGLVTAKPAGYIYEVCSAVSPAFRNEDIYVPVNCSKVITAFEKDYDWKKGFFGNAPKVAATYQLAICMTALLVDLLILY